MTVQAAIKSPNFEEIEKEFDPATADKAVVEAVEYGVQIAAQWIEWGFEHESTPGGSAWAALSPWYERWKSREYGGKKILEREGTLKAAAISSVSQATVNAGSGGAASATVNYSGPAYGEYLQEKRVFFALEGGARDDVEEKMAAKYMEITGG
jgi:hypothetical protein